MPLLSRPKWIADPLKWATHEQPLKNPEENPQNHNDKNNKNEGKTDGKQDGRANARMQADLSFLEQVYCLTPNSLELADVLAGFASRLATTSDTPTRKNIQMLDEWKLKYPNSSLYLKGGHALESFSGEQLEDILYDGDIKLTHAMLARNVTGINSHGSGCLLASALACFLAKGHSLTQAASLAHQFTALAFQNPRHLPGVGLTLNVRLAARIMFG